MTLDIRIKELRKERGLTQQDLADKVRVTATHISEIERGKKNLNNHLIERIAAALGVSPRDIFGGHLGEEWDEIAAIYDDLSPNHRARLLAYALGLASSEQSE